MKKICNILILLFAFVTSKAQQAPICCPEFALVAGFQPCDKDRICESAVPHEPNGGNPAGNPTPGGQSNQIIACKNQSHKYLVVPNLPGFTYSWTVVGGTPTSSTGNPVIITWGSGTQGYIQVIIKNADSSCRDTIRKKVCLIDGPTAAFTFAPTPVCTGSLVCFNSSGSVGATSYYWDFGDGNTSTLPNPCHTYTSSGPFTVVLTVSGSVVDSLGNLNDCGCKDTAKAIINVSNKKGIDIYTKDCRKMLCAGDTVKYCTSAAGCTFGPTPVAWTVNGGTIISGQNTNCITVVWNVPPTTLPTGITLNANCPGTCGNTATLNVPVLFPNLPIQGPNVVCPNATASYALPALPGTFYKWTLSGGGTIAGYDSNHNVITVQWGNTPGGMFILTCDYINPYSGCKGKDTIGVFIRAKFQLTGPSPVCETQTANYFANGPATGWTFTPATGFTNSPIGATGQSITWNLAGIYTITAFPVTPANYCTPSASINVVVNKTPVLNPIVGTNIVCPNQLYNYTVSSNTPGGNYTWIFTTGTGTIAPYGANNSSASIIFTGAGPWVLQASQTVNGCTGLITHSVTKVPPPPAITLTPGGSICSGGLITATVTGVVPPGGYVWSVTPGTVLTAGQGTTTATFTVNSNATITITSCGGSTSANVTVTPATVTITQTAGTCSATLIASPGGGTYSWFLNGNPAGSGSPITVNQNGTYVVQANYSGCIATSQIIVTGITPVVTTITALGSLCNGGSVTITASVTANCPSPVYTWSNGFVGNPLVVTTPGNYFVTVACSNGCTDVSNVITVSPCPPSPCPNPPCPTCINDLVISPSNCPNPVALTTNIPPGCVPVSTSWSYGDGYVGTNGNHLYNNVGNYNVTAVMTCANGTVHCGSRVITVPMVDSFTYVISCGVNSWNVQLQDASIYLPTYAGYSILWTTTCGTLSANNIPNPTLTVPFGCNPTVTLTISKNGCTLTKPFTFNFPSTPLTINGPATVCKGANNTFSSSYTTGVLAYAWNFGDATTGVTNPITHAYNGTPTNPVITLSITDQYGCVFTATKPIAVVIPIPLTISPSPVVKICPDCASPVTLTTNPVVGFTNYQWYQNGTAIGGATSSTYQLCNFNASGNYYVTAINSANNNCPVTSDTVSVVYLPKPLADIQGQTVQCASGTSPYNISLQNAGGNNPNYTYLWTATGPGSVTFSPDNLQYYASASVTQLGTYQFILTVTDITTGCKAKDTFCVYLYKSPTLTVNAPANMCEGTMHNMSVTVSPTGNYLYQWNTGATTSSITTAQAGNYSVTVTDSISGCSAYAFVGTIKKRPYVDLFPIGCDTLCDTVKLIPPLPLAPGQTYNGVYIIKWYVDGNYDSTGLVLNLGVLTLGQHAIHIVVTDILTNCTSTSGKYDVFIKHCGQCDCEKSHWGETEITEGEKPPVDGKAKVKVNNPQVGNPIKLNCGVAQKLDCNKTYTVSSTYNCKDSLCPPKVTYSLQPPTGSPITGTGTITFTTSQTGTYILTMYGWCGDKICDSCVIDLIVDCKKCDCKGSKWGKQMVTMEEKTKSFSCGESFDVKCKKPITVNAMYNCADATCNGAVTFSLQPPSGAPITGNLPYTFTPLLPGTYTLTMYGWCGTTLCDSCVIKFKTDCKEEDCCPYEITATTGTVKYDYTQIPKATVAAQTFTINGLSLTTITEVRANVVSYDITDNFGKECMKCVNLPFTWASITSAANIGAAPGLITMYGGTTVASFNGSGADAYKNPREVIWNNGSPIAIPNGTNIGLNFILPPVPAIDCCELKGKICVKFNFRDKDCKECEVIACFDFVIKKK